jgi:hypothetical protein
MKSLHLFLIKNTIKSKWHTVNKKLALHMLLSALELYQDLIYIYESVIGEVMFWICFSSRGGLTSVRLPLSFLGF